MRYFWHFDSAANIYFLLMEIGGFSFGTNMFELFFWRESSLFWRDLCWTFVREMAALVRSAYELSRSLYPCSVIQGYNIHLFLKYFSFHKSIFFWNSIFFFFLVAIFLISRQINISTSLAFVHFNLINYWMFDNLNF